MHKLFVLSRQPSGVLPARTSPGQCKLHEFTVKPVASCVSWRGKDGAVLDETASGIA
jgi:hypothetical protein